MAENIEISVQNQADLLRSLGSYPLLAVLNGPNPEDTGARNHHAAELAALGGFGILCVGGQAAANREWIVENYADELSPAQVIADDTSHDTIGNAISTSRHAKAVGADCVGVVTLPYHMPRALYDFKKVLGPDIAAVPCSPEHSVYGARQNSYLKTAGRAIQLRDYWQLRGFDPTEDDALDALEARLHTGHRYGSETKGLLPTILKGLDRITTGRSKN